MLILTDHFFSYNLQFVTVEWSLMSPMHDNNRNINSILDKAVLITQRQISFAQEVQAIIPCDPYTNHALCPPVQERRVIPQDLVIDRKLPGIFHARLANCDRWTDGPKTIDVDLQTGSILYLRCFVAGYFTLQNSHLVRFISKQRVDH